MAMFRISMSVIGRVTHYVLSQLSQLLTMAGWGIPVRYLCVILLPVMTNIVDYVAAAPYLYSEPLAIAMCATGPWDSHGTAMAR